MRRNDDPALAFAQCRDFRRSEHPPFARAQVAQLDAPDAHPAKLQHFVADFIKHQADLALQALPQNHAQLARLPFLDRFYLRASADNVKTAQKFLPMIRREGFIDGDLILLVDLVARMREREREIAVVGHQEQALALQIEAAHVEDTRPMGR
ncbi:MAG TPA: hypothetical protein VGH90_00115, partial [Chthoniobacteraceae bacterium]